MLIFTERRIDYWHFGGISAFINLIQQIERDRKERVLPEKSLRKKIRRKALLHIKSLVLT